ncbi:hypothetical protein ACFY6U_06390 [Streptomyces sp. NPDC013157]|uniref:hypothetical protein n=1 Tax=Streptomyces sp. NPDC013157 TaxID=3364861 RepID=UPI003684CCA0
MVVFKAGKSPAAAAAAATLAPAVELVDWCYDKPAGKDCKTRTDACLKNIGSGKLVFVDTDEAEIGLATCDFEQRIKAYPNKGASGPSVRGRSGRARRATAPREIPGGASQIPPRCQDPVPGTTALSDPGGRMSRTCPGRFAHGQGDPQNWRAGS